jgi:hypothetical protein
VILRVYIEYGLSSDESVTCKELSSDESVTCNKNCNTLSILYFLLI